MGAAGGAAWMGPALSVTKSASPDRGTIYLRTGHRMAHTLDNKGDATRSIGIDGDSGTFDCFICIRDNQSIPAG